MVRRMYDVEPGTEHAYLAYGRAHMMFAWAPLMPGSVCPLLHTCDIVETLHCMEAQSRMLMASLMRPPRALHARQTLGIRDGAAHH